MPDFLKLSQQAFESSSAYIDGNLRKDWDYSLRAFRNEHASESKYNSEEYKARSHIFRPKTRSIIRKNEAAGALALFSNMETTNIQAPDPDNQYAVDSAEMVKAVVEYRLRKSIPTFPLVMGALQDAQTVGAVVSYQYWEYAKRKGKVIKDRPCIELRPLENIRFDAGASWIDVAGTTPYLCDIIPMKVCDVRAMVDRSDDKTKIKFKKVEDADIEKARPDVMDSTRRAREGGKQEPDSKIKDFDTVWVMRWMMKDSQGEDWTYYTLGTEKLFSEPLPVYEVYDHLIDEPIARPYVIGYAVIETHKAIKSGLPMLLKPLQLELNDIANQRLDNVKFVLNKRWLVARGRQVDVQSLVRNVPGGVTLVTDPKLDVQESNWPDVTQSSYVEQDRLNSDFDDLAGNFSPATRQANTGMNDTLGGAKLATQSAGIMTDYLLRTFIETWWEPVLRQVVLLERYYENDQTILLACGKKAKLFPKYMPEQMSQLIEQHPVDVLVNVGMGASDPQQRLQRFVFAIKLVIETIATAPPGMNVKEIAKEIFSMAGYRDGVRFISEQEDPRLMKAMQALQQMKQMLEGKQMELQAKQQTDVAQIQSTEKIKAAELQADRERVRGDLKLRQDELMIDQARVAIESMKVGIDASSVDNEMKGNLLDMFTKMEAIRSKPNQELQATVDESTSQVNQRMDGIEKGLKQAMRDVSDIQGLRGDVQRMATSLEAFAAMSKRRKAKGITVKKNDGKASSVAIRYDDGSSDEVPVER